MPQLVIRLKKNPDGTVALSCTRPDGSVTWQRHRGAQAGFFPLHDLTHYAVETVLAEHQGFWSLVALGWNLTDFGQPWPRGPLPPEAEAVERVVGLLDAERASGTRCTAGELNEQLALAARTLDRAGIAVTDAQLGRIRGERRRLFEAWQSVPAGEALVLHFALPPAPRGPVPSRSRSG